MSDTETKIADAHGQFRQAVGSGQRPTEGSWQPCRIVLTTERLVLVGEDERELPLAAVERIDDRYDDPRQTASVSDFVAVHTADGVVLLSATDQEAFETDLFRAVLDGEIAHANHPAVKGGVVQDTEWIPARMRVSDDSLHLAFEDDRAVAIERADIGDLETAETVVAGAERTVMEVEHTQDGISVETHLAVDHRHATVLSTMLGESADRNRADLDLSNTELRVVVALHSGVSPFDIPTFAGIEVEECEEIYDRLLALDVVDVVRERTEVALTARGRRVAGETTGE